MEALKYITMTQLFWDTLEKHRNHPRYADIRARIAWTVERKIENRNFSNNNDSPFVSNAKLVGIWHAKLSVNPDVVMFYTIDGDTMNLALIGTHHDYPHAGKHSGRADTLGRKVRSHVERGHVPTPGWPEIKWEIPADINRSYELEETTLDNLEGIEGELAQELGEAPRFQKAFGHKLDDSDIDTFTAWLEETDRALENVNVAQGRVRAISRGKEKENTPIAALWPKPGR